MYRGGHRRWLAWLNTTSNGSSNKLMTENTAEQNMHIIAHIIYYYYYYYYEAIPSPQKS